MPIPEPLPILSPGLRLAPFSTLTLLPNESTINLAKKHLTFPHTFICEVCGRFLANSI